MKNNDSQNLEKLYIEHIGYSRTGDSGEDPIRKYGIIRSKSKFKFPVLRKKLDVDVTDNTPTSEQEEYDDSDTRTELTVPELKEINSVNRGVYKVYMAKLLDDIEADYKNHPKIRYIFDENKEIRNKILDDLLRGFSDNYRIEFVAYEDDNPIFKLLMHNKIKFIKVYLSDDINKIRYESIPLEELE